MKKALLDTNVILDAMTSREPFRASAERIILLAAEGKIEVCLTASSVTDLYYIARKHLDEDAVREALRNLFQVFAVVDVRGQDCEAALDLPLDDYEDALMAVCGRKAGADFVVTRDKEFLAAPSSIAPAISPEAFLKKVAKA